ncbi:hypothetical protein T11_15770 [Trichinella zimbabwensis]|uniref:Peptidase aspartic putative domain-containing protein n=1 Tax=Trichinella zimbabwensis TaxID=268475 RepID=A0A0V1I979_9BILA|nr:hypothetical protein T11_15770 [Trichinella zimbabwensis]
MVLPAGVLLSGLKCRRGGFKSKTTLFCRDHDTLLRETRSRKEISKMIDVVSKYLVRCREAHDAVEVAIINDEEREDEVRKWASIESEVSLAVARAEENLETKMEFVEPKKAIPNSSTKEIGEYVVTTENYPAAMRTLEKRFGDVELVIERHIEAMLDMKRSEKGKLSDLHTELSVGSKITGSERRKGQTRDVLRISAQPSNDQRTCAMERHHAHSKRQAGNEEEGRSTNRQGSINEGCSRRDGPVLHIAADCRMRSSKRTSKVNDSHPLLSREGNSTAKEETSKAKTDYTTKKDTEETLDGTDNSRNSVKTSNGDQMNVMCLFDSGSQRSDGGRHEKLRRVTFSKKGIYARKTDAYWVRKICDTLEKNPPVKWNHTRNLHLAAEFPRERCDVDVLIGIDYHNQFPRRICVQNRYPIAMDSTLGWILCGEDTMINSSNAVKTLRVDVKPTCDCENYRSFWELEVVGIRDKEEPEQTANRRIAAQKELLSNVARLPWNSKMRYQTSTRLL